MKNSNHPYLGLFLDMLKEIIIFEKYGQLLSSALIPLFDTQAYYMLSPKNLEKF
jgi:hypothetical protein